MRYICRCDIPTVRSVPDGTRNKDLYHIASGQFIAHLYRIRRMCIYRAEGISPYCSVKLKNEDLQNYPPPFRPKIKMKVSIFTRNTLTCNINFIKEQSPSFFPIEKGMISFAKLNFAFRTSNFEL